MKDYFKTLGVSENATEEDIKKAYKKLAMKHHPDRGGTQAEFQEIQEAYDTLSDPQKRNQWEQQRFFRGGHPGGFHGGPGGFQFNFGFGPNIDDIFQQFTGGRPFRQTARNRDLRMNFELDLESTLDKQIYHVNVRHINGTTKTVEIEIPRGVQTGMQMKFPGQGDHSITDLPPGDLYIDFRIRPHREFKISGINLIKTISLNCIDAILGTKVEVTGLDGLKFEINIPPCTQNETKFRLPTQGLWDVNHPTRGDLFLEISVYVPSTITKDQFDQLQQKIS